MAQPADKLFITIDFTPLMSLRKTYMRKAEAILRDTAQTHLEQQQRRFIVYSSGGGNWKPLAESTVDRKQREGWPYPFRILVRSEKMSQSMRYRLKPNKTGYFVGFVREDFQYPKLYFKGTVIRLALMHHSGEGRNPARQVVDEPTNAESKELVDVVRKHFKGIAADMNSNRVINVNP